MDYLDSKVPSAPAQPGALVYPILFSGLFHFGPGLWFPALDLGGRRGPGALVRQFYPILPQGSCLSTTVKE